MNISMKLIEMLIDAFVPFFPPSWTVLNVFYEITFGRRPSREEGARAIFLPLKN